MHVRAVTFAGATNIDAGFTYLSDHVVPILRSQEGYRGMTASADRSNGLLGIISFWETSEGRDASDIALAPSRSEGLNVIGGTVSVENFEQMVAEIASPPVVGSSLMVNRISMSPSKIDENLEYFKSKVLPEMMATPGVQTVRNFMNRETGQGMVGIAWSNKDAMAAAAGEAARRREEAIARGIKFDSVSLREIALVDFR